MKFYNRVNELKHLKNIYSAVKNKFQLCVIFGRRRIGKTELVRKFLKEKQGVYIFIEIKNITLILNELEEYFEKQMGFKPKFNNLDSFFNFIKTQFEDKTFVIIFDEFQNFNAIDPSIMSKFQRCIDEMQNSKIMMICVGSYIGLMKKIFMDKKQPLFGRSDYTVLLKPFSFNESVTMFNDYGVKKFEDTIILYGIFDGIPKYINYLSNYKASVSSIINSLFLDSFAPLLEEGKNILVQEFGGEHKGYFSILEAIASGYNTPDRIKDFSGLQSNTISKYLVELKDYYELIDRIIPITKKQTTKQSRYRLSDNFYKFWFRYVYKNMSGIQFNPDAILEKILNDVPTYCGEIYEQVCQEYLLNKFGKKNDFIISEFGKWWTSNDSDEIDIVILYKKKFKAIFAECKFRNKMTDIGMIKEFHDRVNRFQWKKDKRSEYLYYFSMSGFTKSAMEYCKENKITMVKKLDII